MFLAVCTDYKQELMTNQHKNAKTIVLAHPSREVSGTVQLTGSKSESNRALIIQALSQGAVRVENLSEAADTAIMRSALEKAENADNKPVIIDIGPAGTAMRFLTAYLSLVPGEFVLTGTERMRQRPIGVLAEALKTLGADIRYEGHRGFPPLRITGPLQQRTDTVSVRGNVSSQYISALLLIAPALEKGLTLCIEGELTSRPYVAMTLDMLAEAGISHAWTGDSIRIEPQKARETTLRIEPDWSAASYWYSIVALAEKGEIFLPGLRKNSLQGDIAIAEIMRHFGVATVFSDAGIRIRKTDSVSDKRLFDFRECPDLAQTVVALAVGLKRDIAITGVETLKIKETDRLHALKTEIGKFGAELLEDGEVYHLRTENVTRSDSIRIATYDDHRMAMAFAPFALVFRKITIENPQVVEKSYPGFWRDLERVGFENIPPNPQRGNGVGF